MYCIPCRWCTGLFYKDKRKVRWRFLPGNVLLPVGGVSDHLSSIYSYWACEAQNVKASYWFSGIFTGLSIKVCFKIPSEYNSCFKQGIWIIPWEYRIYFKLHFLNWEVSTKAFICNCTEQLTIFFLEAMSCNYLHVKCLGTSELCFRDFLSYQ